MSEAIDLLPNPFVDQSNRFVLDQAAFLNAIMPGTDIPKFLADPSPEYLKAAEIEPILRVLAKY